MGIDPALPDRIIIVMPPSPRPSSPGLGAVPGPLGPRDCPTTMDAIIIMAGDGSGIGLGWRGYLAVIESRYFKIVDYPTAAALSFTLMAAILILVTIYIRKSGTEELV